MRNLYKESDHLKIKLSFYRKLFSDEIAEAQKQYLHQHEAFVKEMQQQEQGLINDCNEIEKEYHESLISYG